MKKTDVKKSRFICYISIHNNRPHITDLIILSHSYDPRRLCVNGLNLRFERSQRFVIATVRTSGIKFYWNFRNLVYSKHNDSSTEAGVFVYASTDRNWTANTSQKAGKYSSRAEFKCSDSSIIQRSPVNCILKSSKNKSSSTKKSLFWTTKNNLINPLPPIYGIPTPGMSYV